MTISITSGTLRDRVIILKGYEDAPQWRSIEPQTLGLLGFAGFYPTYGEK